MPLVYYNIFEHWEPNFTYELCTSPDLAMTKLVYRTKEEVIAMEALSVEWVREHIKDEVNRLFYKD